MRVILLSVAMLAFCGALLGGAGAFFPGLIEPLLRSASMDPAAMQWLVRGPGGLIATLGAGAVLIGSVAIAARPPRVTPDPEEDAAQAAVAVNGLTRLVDMGVLRLEMAQIIATRINPPQDRVENAAFLHALESKASSGAAADTHALNLFTDGHFDEANRVLRAAAENAGAGAGGLFRELGALFLPVDSEKALAAFLDAVRQEATDFWTFVFIARLAAAQGQWTLAETALSSAKKAAFGDYENMMMASALGDFLFGKSEIPAALEFRRMALHEAYIQAAELKTADARRDLASALEKAADAMRLLEGPEMAAAHYVESLSIRRALAAEFKSAELRRELTQAEARFAALTHAAEDPGDAPAADLQPRMRTRTRRLKPEPKASLKRAQ